MKRSTGIVMAIMVFSFFGLLTMPLKADAGRFRSGNTIQSQNSAPQYLHKGQGIGFVDANGDGINDNFVDADGDGICDNTGLPVGTRGAGFVDANGDGVNDNFVDLNGDGICDWRQ